MVGVCSFLGNEENEIVIGHSKDNQVIIDSNPLSFKAPYGIKENEDTNKEDEVAREQIIETNRSPEDYFVGLEENGDSDD
ncbi:hypothetical protein HYT84_04895 [Candidatus Micrarchaeota archaeon]|nr:hypothetical protein [Candidatus Micrarchaeota archaeon]